MNEIIDCLSSLWARRRRITLTVGFQVGHDTVMGEIDFLHWTLGYALGRQFANIVCGPLALSVMRAGGLHEQAEIVDRG